MTYLVQKTNMFKQKMKIDDNIIWNKVLTVQLQYICTHFQHLRIVLTEFMMYYPRQPGDTFRWGPDCASQVWIDIEVVLQNILIKHAELVRAV